MSRANSKSLAWPPWPCISVVIYGLMVVSTFCAAQEHELVIFAIWSPEAHTDLLECVVYSPDGSLIATASQDATIGIWDAKHGGLQRFLRGHTSRVRSISFSPDSSRLVSGSSSGNIAGRELNIWDVATGEVLWSIEGSDISITAVAYSPNGRIVSASGGGRLRFFDAFTGEMLVQTSQLFRPITAHAYTHDGSGVIAGNSESRIDLYTFDDSERPTQLSVRSAFSGHPRLVTPRRIDAIAASPDGRAILSCAFTSALMWDLETGETLFVMDRHSGAVNTVAFSPDGRRAAIGANDRTVHVWDVVTGAEVRRWFFGDNNFVVSVAFSPDGARIAAAAMNLPAMVSDIETGEHMVTLDAPRSNVLSVAFSPDGSYFFTGEEDGYATVWNRDTKAVVSRFQVSTELDTPIRDASFSPDGSRLAIAAAEQAGVYDTETGAQLFPLQAVPGNRVYSTAISPAGDFVLTGDGDGFAWLWDAQTGQLVRPLHGHAEAVMAVAFSPDGSRALTGSLDGSVLLWDPATGEALRLYFEWNSPVRSAALSPDGSAILVGLEDGSARLLDADSGEELQAFPDHTSWVVSVQFSPDGSQVLTGAYEDGSAMVWDVDTGERIREFREFRAFSARVNSAAYSPDGAQVLTGGDGPRNILLWHSRKRGDVNGDELVDALDVQFVINAAMGLELDPGIHADLNHDGVVNALDVQIVINASLGIAPLS